MSTETDSAQKIPSLFHNYTSYVGAAIAIASFCSILLLASIELSGRTHTAYLGIFAYVLLPTGLILGLAVIVLGMLLERRRRRRMSPGEVASFPRIDFNNARSRRAFFTFIGFSMLFVFMSAFGSYKAFEHTESVAFCGQTCHETMKPEFVAYGVSPHAHVRCVECHVGSGAHSYFKSKISGTRQVVKVVLNNYSRPIPTPVHNLRPAPETCEQCHWPKKFYGRQLKVFTHYSSDEKNTVHQVRLLINTGGGDPATEMPQGIHWHMNISNEIDFVATDEHRQVIPYIHVKDAQGRVTEYFAQDSKLTREQITVATKRRMDCADCHSRPAHNYLPPEQAVDQSLQAHRLDVSLPFIKQQALAVLTGKYDSTDAAMQGIAQEMNSFYATKYSGLAKMRQVEIRNAVDELQQIFRRTTFPEMKLNWQTHPNNLGHFYFNGCFRCHDGQHVSADGRVIKKDCDLCHTVLGQDEGSVNMTVTPTLSFQHPVDIGDLTQMNCSDCHAGGVSP